MQKKQAMKLKCLACEALARIVYLSAARSPHIVDVELFKIGLHNDPDDLRARLQQSINATAKDSYDAVVMGYGLCGKATHGIVAREIPVVIPRAHDCITLFLGSRERYKDQFENYPGTYWYVLDYMQRTDGNSTSLSLGAEIAGGGSTDDVRSLYDEYVAKYGQDNADYLMEVMGAWQQHYKRAVYIDTLENDGADTRIIEECQDTAARRGWTFERLAGDLVLIRRLLYGDWANDFLILQPGQEITMSYNNDIVSCLERM